MVIKKEKDMKLLKMNIRTIKLTTVLSMVAMMVSLMTGCKDTDDVVRDTRKEEILIDVKNEKSDKGDVYDEIFLLNNEIPCGLLLKNSSQKDVIELMGEPNEYSEWSDFSKGEKFPQLIYSGYKLYGYDTSIEMNFDVNDILVEIYVHSEIEWGKVAFAKSDIERIAAEIEQCLNVKPRIGKFEGIQYTFVSNNLIYHMDTYESRVNRKRQNSFNLCISKEKDETVDRSTIESDELSNQNKMENNKIYSYCGEFINSYPEDILDYVSSSESATVTFNILSPSDSEYYKDYKEILEDVAKLLGAEEKDGSFLYRHAGNSIGSSRAYFSWRFLVDSKEYLVYVLDIDSREYWTVGIADYETTE